MNHAVVCNYLRTPWMKPRAWAMLEVVDEIDDRMRRIALSCEITLACAIRELEFAGTPPANDRANRPPRRGRSTVRPAAIEP